MEKRVLITGATGMIGKKLVPALIEKGYQVSMLSRNARPLPNTRVFLWNVENQTIDSSCFDGVSAIIHLAGENIASKRWTAQRKQQILDSRVNSTKLLYKGLASRNHNVDTLISASAVGYYGDRADEMLTEISAPGDDFLASCCVQWEAAVDEGTAHHLRLVKLRTGFILDKADGGLPLMALPVKMFFGAALGSGKQWIPWIHLHDMINLYIHALENALQGVFNAAAPAPVTNKTFTKILAHTLQRPVWPLHVPAAVIKTIMGEMSAVALSSNRTSAQKVLNTGFNFRYNQLQDALAEIYL
jgi:uncharacterized protein (TIGR01777 family)